MVLTTHAKAPVIEITDITITQKPPTVSGVPYNWHGQFKLTDEKGIQRWEFAKSASGAYYVMDEYPAGTKEAIFAFGYGGAKPPGDYYYKFRVYDYEGNYSYVKTYFTLS